MNSELLRFYILTVDENWPYPIGPRTFRIVKNVNNQPESVDRFPSIDRSRIFVKYPTVRTCWRNIRLYLHTPYTDEYGVVRDGGDRQRPK